MFSWIIELILGGLPSWIWPAIAGGGFVVYSLSAVLGTFPAFKPYAMFIKPLGAVICVGGIFMFGGAGVTAIYQAQVEEMKHKVELAEQASKGANDLLAEKSKAKAKVVHDVTVVYRDRIKEVEKQIDADCKLDSEVPKIINDAARNPLKATK